MCAAIHVWELHAQTVAVLSTNGYIHRWCCLRGQIMANIFLVTESPGGAGDIFISAMACIQSTRDKPVRQNSETKKANFCW